MERPGNIGVMSWQDGATAVQSEAAVARTRLFEALVAEHARMVFRVAYSVLRNSHDAEDVVQETFLNAWRARFEEVEEPRPWLGKIAWRAAVARAGKRPPEGAEQLEVSADEPNPEEQAAMRERMQLLHRMITSLPEDLRQTLALTIAGEMNSREVAEVLGIPEASVRTRLFRARQMLKEKLAKHRVIV